MSILPHKLHSYNLVQKILTTRKKLTLLNVAISDIDTHPCSSINDIKYWSVCRFPLLQKEIMIRAITQEKREIKKDTLLKINLFVPL